MHDRDTAVAFGVFRYKRKRKEPKILLSILTERLFIAYNYSVTRIAGTYNPRKVRGLNNVVVAITDYSSKCFQKEDIMSETFVVKYTRKST